MEPASVGILGEIESLTITPEQFAAFAPLASAPTRAALFAVSDGQSVLNRILMQHDITEPPAVAMFLALAGMASDGFTKFNSPSFGLAVPDWLSKCAREWQRYELSEDAVEWRWEMVAECAATLFGIDDLPWSVAASYLASACNVLGIEDESEKYALDDRGASE